ncbi:RcnB family protein, partial [Enterococcus faecalis]
QQHKWQQGYVMPQHYRGKGYKVEYKDHNLPKPNRNQQWYKINNDYILVDADSNNILRIMGL